MLWEIPLPNQPNHRKHSRTQPNLSLHLSFPIRAKFQNLEPSRSLDIVEQTIGGDDTLNDQRWITTTRERERSERNGCSLADVATAGRPTLTRKKFPDRDFTREGERRRPRPCNSQRRAVNEPGEIKFLAQNFPVNIASSVFNLVQKILEQYFCFDLYLYIYIDFSTMLRKFILNTDRLKFLPIPGLWSWRRTPRIWNFRTKRWITTQGPPSTAGFPLSGSRYIYISFFFFFGHRFNGAVAREPLGEDSFSDASFALGLLWKIYVCICVYVCVCGGLFYPSIDHFSFLLRVLDRLDRYTEFGLIFYWGGWGTIQTSISCRD